MNAPAPADETGDWTIGLPARCKDNTYKRSADHITNALAAWWTVIPIPPNLEIGHKFTPIFWPKSLSRALSWLCLSSFCPFSLLSFYFPFLRSGPSKATAKPGETFSRGFQTVSRGPSGRKFMNFSFQNITFWRTLYFWPTAGPPKRRKARGRLPLLPHPLDGPAYALSLSFFAFSPPLLVVQQNTRGVLLRVYIAQ